MLYIAPTLLGPDGRALASIPPLAALQSRLQLRYADVRQVGDDLRLALVKG